MAFFYQKNTHFPPLLPFYTYDKSFKNGKLHNLY